MINYLGNWMVNLQFCGFPLFFMCLYQAEKSSLILQMTEAMLDYLSFTYIDLKWVQNSLDAFFTTSYNYF